MYHSSKLHFHREHNSFDIVMHRLKLHQNVSKGKGCNQLSDRMHFLIMMLTNN